MVQASHTPQDTWIGPPPPLDADDRRRACRVPAALKVRLGPPHAPPETTLLCEDVSEGGLFVRCGQAVQVGARFSVEITLASGVAIYVAEAEVLYNTPPEVARRGFGARFVSIGKEAHAKLGELARFSSDIQPRAEVSGSMILDSAAADATSRVRRVDVPALPSVSDLRLSSLMPTPELDEEPDGELHGFQEQTLTPAPLPSEQPLELDASVPSLVGDLGDEAEDAPVRRRSRGPIAQLVVGFGGAAACGILFLVAVGGSGSPADADTPARIAGRVSGETVGALVSARELAPPPSPAADAPPPVISSALARLDDAPPPPAVVPKAPEPPKPLEAPRLMKPEPVKAEPAKPAKLEPAKVAPAKAAEPPRTLSLSLDGPAKVLRTQVLKGPDRFVVDVQAKKAPTSKDPGVRVGKHADYSRIVIDAKKPLAGGTAEIKGGKLTISLKSK